MDALRDDPAERERKRVAQTQRQAELRSTLEQQQAAYEAEAGRAQEQVLGALGRLADYKAHVGRTLAGLKEAYGNTHAAIKALP